MMTQQYAAVVHLRNILWNGRQIYTVILYCRLCSGIFQFLQETGRCGNAVNLSNMECWISWCLALGISFFYHFLIFPTTIAPTPTLDNNLADPESWTSITPCQSYRILFCASFLMCAIGCFPHRNIYKVIQFNCSSKFARYCWISIPAAGLVDEKRHVK